MKTLIVGLTSLFYCGIAQAQSFEVLNPVAQQGDVVMIRVGPQWLPPAVSNPAISLFGRHYLPNSRGEVFIGIDKNIAPGKHIATFVEYGRGVRLSWDYSEVEILERDFPIRKRAHGKPRNSAEVGEILKAYESANIFERYIDGNFVYPLDNVVLDKDRAVGDVFSPFGGDSHRGVDLMTLDPRTKKHQRPVKAMNSGIIALIAKNFSLEGNMVIIDHGSGIFSLYMHLSRFNVKKGQLVKAGETIGTSGKTGRVTGPHLHFAVRVGDPRDPTKFVFVDPLRFIDLANQYLK